MTSWRKYYIVGDKKKKEELPAAPEKKKRSGRWKLWLFFSVICFLSGLYIGFREDTEWEALEEEIVKDLQTHQQPQPFLYQPPAKNGENFWSRTNSQDFQPIYTNHFECRLKCRNIDFREVNTLLMKPKTPIELLSLGEKYYQYNNYEIVYKVIERVRGNNPPLTVIVAVDTWSKKNTFITVYKGRDEAQDGYCENCE